MSLDLNTGYSNVFKTFVDFAQQRVDANDDKAIADAPSRSRSRTRSTSGRAAWTNGW